MECIQKRLLYTVLNPLFYEDLSILAAPFFQILYIRKLVPVNFQKP